MGCSFSNSSLYYPERERLHGTPKSDIRVEKTNPSRVTLGGWRIDLKARTAAKPDGAIRKLSPKAAEVLGALIDADGEVVSRCELMDQVWPGICVGDESLTQAVAELRRVLEDKCGGGTRASGKKLIETISKRGYRLTAVAVADGEIQPRRSLGPDRDFDLMAYTMCLEARQTIARGGDQAIQKAVELTEMAVDHAPGYAVAHADHAIALTFSYLYALGPANHVERAADHARKAVDLRPDLGLGHAAMGYLHGATQDREPAWAAFGRALARDSSDAFAHYLCARTLFALGDHGAATAIAERAAILSPEDYRPYCIAARACVATDPRRAERNAAAGLERVERRLAIDPSECRALAVKILLLAQLGRFEEAQAALAEDRARGTPLDYYRFVAAAEMGDVPLALDIFDAVTDLGWRHPGWLAAEKIGPCLDMEPRFRRRRQAIGHS